MEISFFSSTSDTGSLVLSGKTQEQKGPVSRFWTSFPTLRAMQRTKITPNIATRVPSTRFPFSPDEVGEVVTGLGHSKQSSPVQLLQGLQILLRDRKN